MTLVVLGKQMENEGRTRRQRNGAARVLAREREEQRSMVRFRNRARISDSVRVGPFRFRLSEPLSRRGRAWGSFGVRTGRRGWLSFSTPLGGTRGRKRRWR